jgi:hypothetical protein
VLRNTAKHITPLSVCKFESLTAGAAADVRPENKTEFENKSLSGKTIIRRTEKTNSNLLTQLNGRAQTFLYLSPALGERNDESDSRIYDMRGAHALDVISELLSIKAMEGESV